MPPDQLLQGKARCFVVLDGKETAIALTDFCMTHDVPQSDFSELDEEPYIPTQEPISAEFAISKKNKICRLINSALRNIDRATWRPRYRRKIQILRYWALQGKRYFKIKDPILWMPGRQYLMRAHPHPEKQDTLGIEFIPLGKTGRRIENGK